MKPGDTLGGLYRLDERLHAGGPGSATQSAAFGAAMGAIVGETWAATALDGAAAPQGTRLAVKILYLGAMPDWKGFDRFEAEAAALKAMSHPAIPRYIDYFRLEEESAAVLVMELVPGSSLAALAESGKRWTESEIELMLADILTILDYVHSLRPPIIHRDVTPKNIIRRPDGGLSLVDFSGVEDAVRLAYRDTSTMLGTAGYAPLEQVSGHASVRSDLYAAAATAAFLLTRVQPADLPVRAMRIDPGAVVELSPRLDYVLGVYLDPDVDKRGLPPADAAAILRGGKAVPKAARGLPLGQVEGTLADGSAGADGTRAAGLRDYGSPEPSFGGADNATAREPGREPVSLPSDSRVRLSVDPARLCLDIPRQSPRGSMTWMGGGFTLFWLGFVAFWTFSAIAMGAPLVFPLFSIPFWAAGVFMARTFIRPALCSVRLTLTAQGGLEFEERTIGRPRLRSWPLADVGACTIEDSLVSQNGRRDTELALEAGSKTLRFGRTLSSREKRAIVGAIGSWLASARRDMN